MLFNLQSSCNRYDFMCLFDGGPRPHDLSQIWGLDRMGNLRATGHKPMPTFKITYCQLQFSKLADYNLNTKPSFVTGPSIGESEGNFRQKRSSDSSPDLTEGNALVQEPEVRRRGQTFRDKHRMELYIIPGKLHRDSDAVAYTRFHEWFIWPISFQISFKLIKLWTVEIQFGSV